MSTRVRDACEKMRMRHIAIAPLYFAWAFNKLTMFRRFCTRAHTNAVQPSWHNCNCK
jgi:hypothetical protein